MLIAAALNYFIGVLLGWRLMFFIGVPSVHAFFVLYIRSRTVEPERWTKVTKETHKEPFWEFFAKVLGPQYRLRTWGNLILLTVGLMGFWVGPQYLVTTIITFAVGAHLSILQAQHLGAWGMAILGMFTIIGCFIAPWLSTRIGRRKNLIVFIILMIIGIVGDYTFAFYQKSLTLFFTVIPILGIGRADFAVFTIWLPKQYPTEVRASGFAFSTIFSRFVADAGTFLLGYLIIAMHTIGTAVSYTALPFVIGIFITMMVPETKGPALPE
ncbi:MAG: MFS transporter [Peptococcaceae bacterium]|jgi:MFS family permease|nr:MFS transporter [Peptococcaceae bacterium]